MYVQMHGFSCFCWTRSSVEMKRTKWSTFTVIERDFRNNPALLILNFNSLVSSWLLLFMHLTTLNCVYFHLSYDWVHRLHQSIRHNECRNSDLHVPFLHQLTLAITHCCMICVVCTAHIHVIEMNSTGQVGTCHSLSDLYAKLAFCRSLCCGACYWVNTVSSFWIYCIGYTVLYSVKIELPEGKCFE